MKYYHRAFACFDGHKRLGKFFKLRIAEVAHEGETLLVQRCLLRGQSPDTCDADGLPVLCIAAMSGNDKMVKILHQRGADPDGQVVVVVVVVDVVVAVGVVVVVAASY